MYVRKRRSPLVEAQSDLHHDRTVFTAHLYHQNLAMTKQISGRHIAISKKTGSRMVEIKDQIKEGHTMKRSALLSFDWVSAPNWGYHPVQCVATKDKGHLGWNNP